MSVPFRISLVLTSIVVCAVLLAISVGIVNNPTDERSRSRLQLSDTIALLCASEINATGSPDIRLLETIVEHNKDLAHLAITLTDSFSSPITFGTPIDTPDVVHIPLFRQGESIGDLTLQFEPYLPATDAMMNPMLQLGGFVGSVCALGSIWYLGRVWRHVCPSKVIPDRVRTTLDAFAEGLIVLNNEQMIVHANGVFSNACGMSAEQLQGKPISDLPWLLADGATEFPWETASKREQNCTGATVHYRKSENLQRTYMVNAARVLDTDRTVQGILISLDDVTEIEQRNQALRAMLSRIEESRDRIRQQNQELRHLATRDPLTSCLNRRAFFEVFELLMAKAIKESVDLSCILLDIDHFKEVNDSHGHAAGDAVLKVAAEVLRDCSRDADIVCRYGGEEFCIVLPGAAITDACRLAERIRATLKEREVGGVSVTSSFGVTSVTLGAKDPQAMIHQSDDALYAAKRSGRDRVVRFDMMPRSPHLAGSSPSRKDDVDYLLPFAPVNALFSALTFRDYHTAEHCRRVADLCVCITEDFMSSAEVYLLEVAALLHEIGKIGVPDAILFKAAPLTDEERQVVRLHDEMGADIVQSMLDCQPLRQILECRRLGFQGLQQRDANLPPKQITLLGKILTICDAYDAMTNEQVYRKAMAPDEAFAELRRFAGQQFDPGQVERFIDTLKSRNSTVECRERVNLSPALAIPELTPVTRLETVPAVTSEAT